MTQLWWVSSARITNQHREELKQLTDANEQHVSEREQNEADGDHSPLNFDGSL